MIGASMSEPHMYTNYTAMHAIVYGGTTVTYHNIIMCILIYIYTCIVLYCTDYTYIWGAHQLKMEISSGSISPTFQLCTIKNI